MYHGATYPPSTTTIDVISDTLTVYYAHELGMDNVTDSDLAQQMRDAANDYAVQEQPTATVHGYCVTRAYMWSLIALAVVSTAMMAVSVWCVVRQRQAGVRQAARYCRD
jgi:hypothetical protein